MNAACTGCSLPSGPAKPSQVVTCAPSHDAANVRHALTRLPSSSTVHAPHAPSLQPFLVAVRAMRSRRKSSRVTRGSSSAATSLPFSLKCRSMRRETPSASVARVADDDAFAAAPVVCRKRLRESGSVTSFLCAQARRHRVQIDYRKRHRRRKGPILLSLNLHCRDAATIAERSLAYGRVEYAVMPPHAPSHFTSTTLRGSIGVSFSAHRRAAQQFDRAGVQEADINAGDIFLVASSDLHWLKVAEPSDALEFHLAPSYYAAVAHELGASRPRACGTWAALSISWCGRSPQRFAQA